MTTKDLSKLLDQVQQLLGDIYHDSTSPSIAPFIISADTAKEMMHARGMPVPEIAGLLAHQYDEHELDLGVYFSPEILETLRAIDPLTSLCNLNVSAFSVVVEEVSHFQLVCQRAAHQLEVSQIELEYQGEVDKLIVCSKLLQMQTGHSHIKHLYELFFHNYTITEHAKYSTYQDAIAYAAKFSSMHLLDLPSQHAPADIEHVRSLLNHMYKMNWNHKISSLGTSLIQRHAA